MGFYNTGNFGDACYKCPKRELHCHADCKDYNDAVAKRQARNKAMVKAKSYEYQAYATDLNTKLLRARC